VHTRVPGKLVIFIGDRDAIMVAATTGRGGDGSRSATLPNVPGVRVEVPEAINRLLKFGRSALEFVQRRLGSL
jgi:hypothetical protein